MMVTGLLKWLTRILSQQVISPSWCELRVLSGRPPVSALNMSPCRLTGEDIGERGNLCSYSIWVCNVISDEYPPTGTCFSLETYLLLQQSVWVAVWLCVCVCVCVRTLVCDGVCSTEHVCLRGEKAVLCVRKHIRGWEREDAVSYRYDSSVFYFIFFSH